MTDTVDIKLSFHVDSGFLDDKLPIYVKEKNKYENAWSYRMPSLAIARSTLSSESNEEITLLRNGNKNSISPKNNSYEIIYYALYTVLDLFFEIVLEKKYEFLKIDILDAYVISDQFDPSLPTSADVEIVIRGIDYLTFKSARLDYPHIFNKKHMELL